MATVALRAVEIRASTVRQERCAANLCEIARALLMSLMDDCTVFPISLAALGPYAAECPGWPGPKTLVCLGSRHRPGAFADVDAWSDYRYHPGLTLTSLQEHARAVVSCPAADHAPFGDAAVFRAGDFPMWLRETPLRPESLRMLRTE